MNDTILTSDFECLDMDFLIRKGNPDKDKREITHYEYKESYENGKIKLYIRGNDKNGYSLFISVDYTDFLSIRKGFYIDGRIKYKGYWNDLGFKIGKWYYFDEYGDIEETKEMEEGFDYTYALLKKKLEKEESLNFSNLKSKNNDGLEYPEIRIVRTTDPRPLWIVEYDDKTNFANGLWGTRIEIQYDGNTGEEVERNIIAQNP